MERGRTEREGRAIGKDNEVGQERNDRKEEGSKQRKMKSENNTTVKALLTCLFEALISSLEDIKSLYEMAWCCNIWV